MAQGGRVFDMVLEHEYMHQETLLYMMQELPIGKKNRAARVAALFFPWRTDFTFHSYSGRESVLGCAIQRN